MQITPSHYLDTAIKDVLPGGEPMNVRRFLVIHFTGGWTAQSSIDFWRTKAAKGANAHLIIDRDGTTFQCRPFNRTAGHAGVSRWTDPKTGIVYRGLNSCSIGIELANCGDLARSTYPQTMPIGFAGEPIPRYRGRHKNGGQTKDWETYDKRQLDAVLAIGRLLCTRYKLDDVVGHDDIAPERKNDPGPAFPMTEIRGALGYPPLP